MSKEKRMLRVKIVEENTGRVIQDFTTWGIMYAHLDEIKDDVEPERIAVGMASGQHLFGVDPFEKLSLLEGLQGIIKEVMEEDPTMQLLMMITQSKKKMVEVDSEED